MRTLIAAVVILPAPALADLTVTFRDGAPTDRFTITNTGACQTSAMTLTLDMGPSAGRVIFDVTGAGAGVQVFQPLEVVAGAEYLAALPEVRDGQTRLSLAMRALPPGAEVAFTIDVDDTIGAREITVNGSEMAGAVISAEGIGGGFEAVFDTGAMAVLNLPGCTS